MASFRLPMIIVLFYSFGFEEILKQYGITYSITDSKPPKDTPFATSIGDKKYIVFTNVNSELKEELCQSFVQAKVSSYTIDKEFGTKDYFNDLVNLDFVDEIELDYDFLSYSYHHPVIKSDMARYKIMTTYGGIWSDFDIIYLKSVDKIIKTNDKCNLFVSYSSCPLEYHSIGFYIATNDHPFFLDLSTEIEAYKHKKAANYQYFGRLFVENFFRSFKSLNSLEGCIPYNLCSDIVYPIKYNDLSKITSVNYELVKKDSLTEDTIGIHWFNGSNFIRQKINEIDKEYKSDKTLMGYYYNKYEKYINN